MKIHPPDFATHRPRRARAPSCASTHREKGSERPRAPLSPGPNCTWAAACSKATCARPGPLRYQPQRAKDARVHLNYVRGSIPLASWCDGKPLQKLLPTASLPMLEEGDTSSLIFNVSCIVCLQNSVPGRHSRASKEFAHFLPPLSGSNWHEAVGNNLGHAFSPAIARSKLP